nr:hypothetical protein [uncultured Bdellovibrio sp.]
MIRSLIALVAMSSVSSFAVAADVCEKLTLSCQATYLSQEGKVVQAAGALTAFEDEHWDEPSLKNCAATAYVVSSEVAKTSVRIYADKDLSGNQVTLSAIASQTEDVVQDGQTYRYGYYSNTNEASSVVGATLNLGTLRLAKPVGNITDVAVTCTVK